MPTLNRSPDDDHYYIRSRYEGTWQIHDRALTEVLAKFPQVARYTKTEICPAYLLHLKRQGWLYRKGEGGSYLAPWEYRQGEFFDSLKAFGVPGVRYPELSVTAGRDGKAWELCILMPAIPQLWLKELPEADYRRLAGERCSFSVDQHRYPASNLFGAPHLVQVTAREMPTYRISTRSNWPSSIDTSAFDCQVESPGPVTVFQPPGTFGARLVNPRLSPGDEIVVLVQTTDGKTRPLRSTLKALQSEACIARGSLRDQETWEVYWIRVPNQGTEIWNLLAKYVGLQERKERWKLDLVLPLPVSVSENGVFEVRPTETLLIRIEHSQANGKGLGPSGRKLV